MNNHLKTLRKERLQLTAWRIGHRLRDDIETDFFRRDPGRSGKLRIGNQVECELKAITQGRVLNVRTPLRDPPSVM
jgi:hypothetical protein